MPDASLKRTAAIGKRKLPEKIDGRDVLVRDLVNDDLDAIDELTDEYAELEVQRAFISKQIEQAETVSERQGLRADGRQLAKQARRLNTQMLGLYIETADGESFSEDLLHTVPVRVQTSLIEAATAILFPEDRPTQSEVNGTG